MKIVVDKTTDVVVAIASNTEILSLTNAGMNSVHGFTPAYTTKNAKLVRGVDAPEGAKAGLNQIHSQDQFHKSFQELLCPRFAHIARKNQGLDASQNYNPSLNEGETERSCR